MADRGSLPSSLLAGYASFRAGAYPAARERYRRLGAEGQRPGAMVVACSGSRSAPQAVFDAGPGELFVVRNVGALVPAYAPDGALHGVSAALEYAVLALRIPAIVVMGHGRCGGIAAALDESTPLSVTDFVGTWVASVRTLAAELDAADAPSPGAPAADGQAAADPDARRLALERRSVERSLANLRTFPWLRARADAGVLGLHGAWFDIALGELHALGDRGWARVQPG